MSWEPTCHGRRAGSWLGLSHCLNKRDHHRHLASEAPMIDITAALIAAGLPKADVDALAEAVRAACNNADDEIRGHEGDYLWETTYGEYAKATEAHAAAAQLREQADTWRGLLYAIEHPA